MFGAGLNDPQATTQQAEQEPAPEEVASKRQAELNALKRKDLKAQARAAGVTQAEIDDAGDTDPAFPSKETLITLIQQREATAAAAAAAAAAVQRQERGVTETIRTLKEDLEERPPRPSALDRVACLPQHTPAFDSVHENAGVLHVAMVGGWCCVAVMFDLVVGGWCCRVRPALSPCARTGRRAWPKCGAWTATTRCTSRLSARHCCTTTR